MVKTRQTASAEIFQVKVTIRDSHPPIWRRLQVPAGIRLDKLHDVLQTAFGWTDSHLHQFIIGDTYYGMPDPEFDDLETHDERSFRLNQVVAKARDKLTYEYDFGDSWEHDIVVEKVLTPEKGVHYPTCTTGKRAGPPEDCGGIGGYENLLQIIQDPRHKEHESMLTWLGGEFDPEAFDVAEVNAALRRIR